MSNINNNTNAININNNNAADDMGKRFEDATPAELVAEALQDMQRSPRFASHGPRLEWDGSHQDLFLVRLLDGSVKGPYSIESVYDEDYGDGLDSLVRLGHVRVSRSKLTGRAGLLASDAVLDIIRVGDYRADKSSVIALWEGRFRDIDLPEMELGGQWWMDWAVMVPIETHNGVDTWAPVVLSARHYNDELIILLDEKDLVATCTDSRYLGAVLEGVNFRPLPFWIYGGGTVTVAVPKGRHRWHRRPALWALSRKVRETARQVADAAPAGSTGSAILDAMGVKRVRHEDWGRDIDVVWEGHIPSRVQTGVVRRQVDDGESVVEVGEFVLRLLDHYLEGRGPVYWTLVEGSTMFGRPYRKVVVGNNDCVEEEEVVESVPEAFATALTRFLK